MVIAGAGTWIVTLDMNNLSYSVGKPIPYMAGDANGWDHSDVLNSDDGVLFISVPTTQKPCSFNLSSITEKNTQK